VRVTIWASLSNKHCEESGQPSSDFSEEPAVADLFVLDSILVSLGPYSKEEVLTWPQPSRRKIRPKVDLPMRALM
jgi:hypothetical protein